jgi:hypothetical protein
LVGNAPSGDVDTDAGIKIVVVEDVALPADWPLLVRGSGTLTIDSLDRDSNLGDAIMRDYSGLGQFGSVVAGGSEGETTISVTGIPE